jgi:hypothetical protein
MLYYILYIIIFLAFFALILGGNYSKSLYLAAVVLLIIYCGLKDPFLYPDITNYYDYFKGDFINATEGTLGIGYLILNRISRLLSPSFFLLLMIISIIVIYSYAKFILEYSPYIWLSLLLFLLVNYYQSFFLLRQYLAMSVFLFSIKYIINRDPIRFGICTILAISFHLTAVIIIPFYFLYGINYSRKNFLLLIAAAIIFIILFKGIGPFINRISAYYAHYFEMESDESAWRRLLMKSYLFLVFLFVMKNKAYDQGINRIVFYCLYLSIIINYAGMNMFGVFRLREYFSLADFIGVSIIIKEATSQSIIKRALSCCLALVYIILLLVSFDSFIKGGNMNNLYQPFWKSELFWKANGIV